MIKKEERREIPAGKGNNTKLVDHHHFFENGATNTTQHTTLRARAASVIWLNSTEMWVYTMTILKKGKATTTTITIIISRRSNCCEHYISTLALHAWLTEWELSSKLNTTKHAKIANQFGSWTLSHRLRGGKNIKTTSERNRLQHAKHHLMEWFKNVKRLLLGPIVSCSFDQMFSLSSPDHSTWNVNKLYTNTQR